MGSKMIDGLSDQEKSVILAKAMEWNLKTHEVAIGGYLFRPDDSERWTNNLYDPANMALAWRVLNWGISDPGFGHEVDAWLWDEGLGYDIPNLPPTDAQRFWLDKILTLAIEAGIVEVSS
jgi:hypothetical protein